MAYFPELPTTNVSPEAQGASTVFGQTYNKAINAPAFDIFSTPEFQQIQQLLNPGAGGLSRNLQGMMDIGRGQIGNQTAGNIAMAKSNAQGLGMEGSSIENNLIQGAEATGANAMNQLLMQLFGMQQGDTNNLIEMLFSGVQGQASDYQNRLNSLLQYLSGGQESAMNLGMFNTGMSNMNNQGDKNRRAQLQSAGINAAGQIVGSLAKAGMLGG